MDFRDLPSAEAHAVAASAPTKQAIEKALRQLAAALSRIVGEDPMRDRGLAKRAPTITRELAERILDAVESGSRLKLSPAEHIAFTGALRARGIRVKLDLLGVRIEHTKGHQAEEYERTQEYCGAPDGERMSAAESRGL